MPLRLKTIIEIAVFLNLSIATGMKGFAQSTGPVNLKCEHLVDPIGLDSKKPRFTWQLKDPSYGAGQTVFEIKIAKDSLDLLRDRNLIWTSGKKQSDAVLFGYEGPAPEPFTKYYWKIVCWDKDGNAYRPSPVASFETGMIENDNWKGAWISDGIDKNKKEAPLFRKDFTIKKRVKKARIYIAAAGLYELTLNGKKIGDHFLDPMYTRFDRRNLYVTHDVTSAVSKDNNTIGVILGNGWYNHQSSAVWYFDQAPWRGRPAFCLDLRIEFDDGSTQTISTDQSWKTELSPIIFNSIYTAEHVDANKLKAGWDKPGFDDSKWPNASYRQAPSKNITAQAMQPIREVEKIMAASFKKFNDSDYVYDLGRNIAGISELRVRGEKGTVIRLKHAERIDTSGHADQSNIIVHYRPKDDSDPFQTDIFTLSGKGEEIFKPKFNYKGFQYLEVTGSRAIKLSKDNLAGYFVHSDVPAVGKIESTNNLLTAIWHATNNAYLSNLMGYPTDCPQREKNGWTGDAHIAIETGLYSFDGITVYEKWLADHRDEQQPNGVLPAIIPTSGWGYQWANGPDWTSTIAIIPWTLYKFYGDSKPLRDCYHNIKKYVDRINEDYPDGLTTWGLGDWVPVKSISPVEFTSSLYYYGDVQILAKAAKLFGFDNDVAYYTTLSEKIKDAINKKYLNAQTGMYGSGLQTELAAPLFWGIVPEDLRQRTADSLARKVVQNGNKLDVGILGAKAILNALSENNHGEVAYALATQTDAPSWGNWIRHGATTLYENWNVDAKNDNSLNHIMFGEIGAWMYKGLGGIYPDETQAGFAHFFLKPFFPKKLLNFRASHNSPRGEIVSGWRQKGGKLIYYCVVPPNSTATISLPGGSKLISRKKPESSLQFNHSSNTATLPSGSYEFLIRR